MSENGQVVDADEASFNSKHEKTLGSHLAYEVFRSLHSDRKRVALVDYAGAKATEVDAQGLLVLATLLADRLKKATSAKRVGIVLPPGIGGVVANLAVVFAGKVPVNLNFSLGRAAVAVHSMVVPIKTTQPGRMKVTAR